ncbi:MarR family winged helix-turn-helix transcriptional regulator [Nocardia sp. NPDC058666]|uniref:MarR family winged helix-turn-helix transcriptional regulator n=1 Tax=Nocardia sp. NPDC058666 TaxID=3346587 RepID=UPI003665CCDD
MSREVSADWSRVAAFAAAVDVSLGKWLADQHGIGLTEYRAVAHLSAAADKELRVNDLAVQVGLNQSSVTRLVSRLEAKGLAIRDLCPDDRRGVYAVITEKGESLLHDSRAAYDEQVRELLGNAGKHFPHFDLIQLRRSLAAVGDLIP